MIDKQVVGSVRRSPLKLNIGSDVCGGIYCVSALTQSVGSSLPRRCRVGDVPCEDYLAGTASRIADNIYVYIEVLV